MKPQEPLMADGRVRLTRQDLIAHEHALKDSIREFLPFASYSLFFPQTFMKDGDKPEVFGGDPAYLRSEGELLLPLVLDGELLAYFVARGVKLKAPRTSPAYLQALATASLEKLLLVKRCVTDSLTGLHNREYFLDSLASEIELVKRGIMAEEDATLDARTAGFSGCLGMIALDLDYFQWINENYGYEFGDRVLAKVGQAVKEACPEQAIPSRIAEDGFAVLLPEAASGACSQLAETLREKVAGLRFVYEVTGESLAVTASLGAVNYPQDLRGAQLQRSAFEQARILNRKARKAVLTAKDFGRDRLIAFGDVVKKGGKILKTLPLERVSVNLGRSVDAQESQRFLVWSPKYPPSEPTMELMNGGNERVVGRYPAMYKGEIAVMEVQEDMAFAEILHLSDPSWPIEAGDRLTLITEKESIITGSGRPEDAPSRDMLTGLYNYRDFIGFYNGARQRCPGFTMGLVRVLEDPRVRSMDYQKHMETRVRRTAVLGGELFGLETVGARYSLGTLLYFFPNREPGEVLSLGRELVRLAARDSGVNLALGLASYPYLTFKSSDMVENCRKALDHAMLLPDPMVAMFDSVSMNISADRKFVESDLYDAVEEYKLSLLADPDNVLARNSLGICLAKLGRQKDAKHHFEEVVKRDQDNVMALYNLGYACHLMGDREGAEHAYSRCLELSPGHVFCLIRLGSLAERREDPETAHSYYMEASRLPKGGPLAARHLARLAEARGETDLAREYLHQALVHNHKDAYSLNLLAKIYLDSGEDPEIAETLARQSAALRPEVESHWDVLARALEAQGRDEDAEQARARASGM